MAVTDPSTRLERLINRSAARFNTEFLQALRLVRNRISLDDLATLLEQGRFQEAFDSVRIAASRLNVLWADSFVLAGSDTARWLGANVPDIVIDFDQTNTRAVTAMRNNQLRMVSSYTEQQRVATQQALIDGIQRGANPREQARAFRNSIGLTPHQERWVRNYERALQELDSNALRRELRDRRFDRTVQRAISNGEPLSRQQIDKMVTRYRERALKLRAETIARTESLRSVHEGAQETYRQAIEAGELQPDQLVRIWNTALDERVRDFSRGAATSHATMHNQERRVDEPFVSGAGNQSLNPGAFGIGMEDINCRCVVSTRILTPAELQGGLSVTVIEETI